jgi:hypothetical protein
MFFLASWNKNEKKEKNTSNAFQLVLAWFEIFMAKAQISIFRACVSDHPEVFRLQQKKVLCAGNVMRFCKSCLGEKYFLCNCLKFFTHKKHNVNDYKYVFDEIY